MPNRIFVIEDDVATRYAYERALNASGYQTVGFRTYFDVAPELEKGAGALLVVDIQMPPKPPQRLEVAQMARHHRPGLPIVFVTGDPETAKTADEEGDPVMLKPIELRELVATVRDLLTASPANPT